MSHDDHDTGKEDQHGRHLSEWPTGRHSVPWPISAAWPPSLQSPLGADSGLSGPFAGLLGHWRPHLTSDDPELTLYPGPWPGTHTERVTERVRDVVEREVTTEPDRTDNAGIDTLRLSAVLRERTGTERSPPGGSGSDGDGDTATAPDTQSRAPPASESAAPASDSPLTVRSVLDWRPSGVEAPIAGASDDGSVPAPRPRRSRDRHTGVPGSAWSGPAAVSTAPSGLLETLSPILGRQPADATGRDRRVDVAGGHSSLGDVQATSADESAATDRTGPTLARPDSDSGFDGFTGERASSRSDSPASGTHADGVAWSAAAKSRQADSGATAPGLTGGPAFSPSQGPLGPAGTDRLQAPDGSPGSPSPGHTDAGLTFRRPVTPTTRDGGSAPDGSSATETRPGETETPRETAGSETADAAPGATHATAGSDHPFAAFPDTRAVVDHLYEAFQRRQRVDRERRGF